MLATLFAATALAGGAFADPATARAAPAEWDIERYDQC